jgi:hypothetical protein
VAIANLFFLNIPVIKLLHEEFKITGSYFTFSTLKPAFNTCISGS